MVAVSSGRYGIGGGEVGPVPAIEIGAYPAPARNLIAGFRGVERRRSVRNRVIKSATFEGRTPDALVTDELIAFHREMAAGGVGMTTIVAQKFST